MSLISTGSISLDSTFKEISKAWGAKLKFWFLGTSTTMKMNIVTQVRYYLAHTAEFVSLLLYVLKHVLLNCVYSKSCTWFLNSDKTPPVKMTNATKTPIMIFCSEPRIIHSMQSFLTIFILLLEKSVLN